MFFGDFLVPKKGLEPPHPCEYVDLNHARLPIPPLRHKTQIRRGLPVRQHLQVSQMAPAVSNNQRAPQAGVFTPARSISAAFSSRFERVSSRLASAIQPQYSRRCVKLSFSKVASNCSFFKSFARSSGTSTTRSDSSR